MRTENSAPALRSITSELSRFLLIFTGVKTAIIGEFILENYYSWLNCTLELLPHPKTLPLVSRAKQWLEPAAILVIFRRFDYLNKHLPLFWDKIFFVE